MGIRALLQLEPGNRQAQELESLVTKRMEFEGMVGMAVTDVGRSKYTWPPLQNAGGSKTSAAKPCNLSSLCIRPPGPPHPWLDLCTWQCSTARQPASNHLGSRNTGNASLTTKFQNYGSPAKWW